MKKILSLIFVASLLISPVFVSAIDGVLPETTEASIDNAITKIGNILFGILLAVALIYILLAAFGFITAGGDAEKIKTAQMRILYSLIGIVIAILAKGMISLVQDLIK